MRGKTNLPKGIIYKEPEVDKTVLHWTPNALPISDNLVKVLQFGEQLIALGDSGNIAVSEDGLYWTCRKIGDYKFYDMVIVDDTCIIVGATKTEENRKGVIARSQDLVSWDTKDDYLWSVKEETSNPSIWTARRQEILAIGYNGKTFILIGQCERIYSEKKLISNLCIFTSDDLYNFNEGNPMKNVDPYLIEGIQIDSIWANNRLVIRHGKDVIVTADGVNAELIQLEGIPKGTMFANGEFFLFMGTSVYTSVGGLNWSKTLIPSTVANTLKLCHEAIYINNKYLLFSDNAVLKLDSLTDYAGQTDYTVVTLGIIITGVTQFKNRIICICEGGVVVTADMETGDKELIVLPQEVDNTMYIKKTDNVRKLLVKAVTADIDEDIRPENIKAGVTILGVTGTYESGV